MNGVPKEMELDFATLNFHEHYVISTIHEDQNLGKKDSEKLKTITENFYQNQHFGYISNRKNHYSLDPLIYFHTPKIGDLIAMAIVVYNSRLKETTAIYEKKFYDKPFQVFDDLKSAEIWMKNLVENKKIRSNA